MTVVHASALSVRHAIARSLATHNRHPSDATFRVVAARVSVDGRGRVVRADVSLSLEPPAEDLGEPRAAGLVNPTGNHPLMAVVPGTRTLLDVIPVSWERWLKVLPGKLPGHAEPARMRGGVEFAMAQAFARAADRRLPTEAELRAAWGSQRFPWGDHPDPSRGLGEPLRYDEVPEVGLFPPSRSGFFDLGCGAWAWTEEGTLLGGLPGLAPGDAHAAPCGLRLALSL